MSLHIDLFHDLKERQRRLEKELAQERRKCIEAQLKGPYGINYIDDAKSIGYSNSRASPLLTNCPNCGAPVNPTSHKCEYCDTPYRQNRNYEIELLIAKNKALNSSIEMRTLYEEALRAMRRYCD